MKWVTFLVLMSVCYVQANVNITSIQTEIEEKTPPKDLAVTTKAACTGTLVENSSWIYNHQLQIDIIDSAFVIGCYEITGSYKITAGGVGFTKMTIECWDITCTIKVFVKNGATKNGLLGDSVLFLTLILHKFL